MNFRIDVETWNHPGRGTGTNWRTFNFERLEDAMTKKTSLQHLPATRRIVMWASIGEWKREG